MQVGAARREQRLRRRDLAIEQARWALNQPIGLPRSTRRPRSSTSPSGRRCRRSARRCATPSATTPSCSRSSRSSSGSRRAPRSLRAQPPAALLRAAARSTTRRSDIIQPQDDRLGLRRLHLGPRHRHAARGARSPQARIAADAEPRRARARAARARGGRARARSAPPRSGSPRSPRAEAAVGQAEENLRIRQQQFDVGRAHERGRARRRGAARRAARDARDRALPGAHAPRRAAAADGPAARRACSPERGDRMPRKRLIVVVVVARRSASPAPSTGGASGGADALHRLRRGRGARAPQRGHRARARGARSARATPCRPDAVVARLDDDDVREPDRRQAPARSPCTRPRSARQEERVAAGRAHLEAATSTRAAPTCGRPSPRRRSPSARLQRERGAGRRPAPAPRSSSTTRARARDQARSALDRAREMLARDGGRGAAASPSRATQLEVLARSASSRRAQLAELEVTRAKYEIQRADRRRPSCRRSSSGRASWRSRARRSSRCSIPRDKYVQIYVPVADVGALPRRPARRDRARQPSRAAASRARSASSPTRRTSRPRRSRRRERPHRPGLSRQGPHPRGRRALPARAPRATSISSTGDRRAHGRIAQRARRHERVAIRLRGLGSASAARRALAGVDLDARRPADRRRRRTRRRRQDDAAARARRPARGRGRARRTVLGYDLARRRDAS